MVIADTKAREERLYSPGHHNSLTNDFGDVRQVLRVSPLYPEFKLALPRAVVAGAIDLKNSGSNSRNWGRNPQISTSMRERKNRIQTAKRIRAMARQ